MILQYILLYSILPLVLYINFFLLDYSTAWSYEIKAWVIYTIILTLGEVAVVIISYFLIIILSKRFNLLFKVKESFTTSLKLFLFGNIFFIASIFQDILWILVPIFQFFIVLTFTTSSLIENKHVKLSMHKQLFSIKKVNDKLIHRKIVSSLVIATTYFLFNTSFLYVVKVNYNPARKSLEYFFEGSGIKVNFKK